MTTETVPDAGTRAEKPVAHTAPPTASSSATSAASVENATPSTQMADKAITSAPNAKMEERSVAEDTPVPVEAAENGRNGDIRPNDDTDHDAAHANVKPDPKQDVETATDATAESDKVDNNNDEEGDTDLDSNAKDKKSPVVSSSKKSRPPYKYDPGKITLRFLFANRDGLTVTIDCNPSDTVGEVKAALLSVWPSDVTACSGGDHLRLICMGKGYLMPDTRTLEDCQIPVFKTHPTPINVSVRPEDSPNDDSSKPHRKKKDDFRGTGTAGTHQPAGTGAQVDQGCQCVVL